MLSNGVMNAITSKTVYAQDNSISQEGSGAGKQNLSQLKDSDLNNQVISCDVSILSGNNLDCQVQDNSNVKLHTCHNHDETNFLGLDLTPLKMFTLLDADCDDFGGPGVMIVLTLTV